jgi:hypothetical protein
VIERLVAPPPRKLPPHRREERRRHLLDEIAPPIRGRRPAHGRRAYAVAGTILATVVLAAPTLALSSRARELVGLSSSHPPYVPAPLKAWTSAPDGQALGLFVTSEETGGECWFVAVSREEEPMQLPRTEAARVRLWVRQGACGDIAGTVHANARTNHLEVEARRACGLRQHPVPGPACVYGWIDPALRASRIELQWRDGAEELAPADGYFVAAAPALADPDEAPFSIVAYDADGNDVARRKVDVAGAGA